MLREASLLLMEDRLSIDAGAIAKAIRAQTALPISAAEAERLARSVESSTDDGDLLVATLMAVQTILAGLETDAEGQRASGLGSAEGDGASGREGLPSSPRPRG